MFLKTVLRGDLIKTLKLTYNTVKTQELSQYFTFIMKCEALRFAMPWFFLFLFFYFELLIEKGTELITLLRLKSRKKRNNESRKNLFVLIKKSVLNYKTSLKRSLTRLLSNDTLVAIIDTMQFTATSCVSRPRNLRCPIQNLKIFIQSKL